MTIGFRRGTCPVCERQIRLTRAGRIWNHNGPATDEEPDAWPRTCEGKGEVPVERAALLLKMDQYMRQEREGE